MPKYNSKESVKSGVPLGGIGAGKLEILPNGTLDYFTFLNNWGFPYRIKYDNRSPMKNDTCQGFGFFLRVKSGKKTIVKVLQTVPYGSLKKVDSIQYEGNFPFAVLKFHDSQIPASVTLEAFSPLIPGDPKNSAMPGAVFLFKFKNPTNKPMEISLLSIGKNVVGQCEIGRYNLVQRNRQLVGMTFKVRNPVPSDITAGELSISIPKSVGKISYLGEQNLQAKQWVFTPETLHTPFVNLWEKTGRLPDTNTKEEIAGGSYQLGGAVSVTSKIAPNSEKIVPVIYSWYFPKHDWGHQYENWFKNSFQAGEYINRHWSEFYLKTKCWQKIISSSKLPSWLKDGLINNLYVLFSGTWWTRKGQFSMHEAPVICPLMGTLDVRYYGSVPLALFFPELEKNEMLQFKNAQRKNGYVPHDLGRERLDMPNNGTTFFFWKDLNPKYILLVYRDYLWTGDKAFLKKIYPSAKKAMEFEFTTDKNQDGLPENEGADQTYDVWEFIGTNSYTSGIYLASLLAMEKLAHAVNDHRYAKKCRTIFEKGSENFEKLLWNGKFFSAVTDGKKRYNSSIAGQLNGQWMAHFLNLGYIADRNKIRKAVRTMIELNGRDSKYGVTNSVFPNGKRDKSNAHSENIWPGESYAVASLAIEEGFVNEGLEIAEKTWKNFTDSQKNPWNQPDVIHPSDGSYGFGDYYMRNMVIWSVLFALSKKNAEAKKVLEGLKKHVKTS